MDELLPVFQGGSGNISALGGAFVQVIIVCCCFGSSVCMLVPRVSIVRSLPVGAQVLASSDLLVGGAPYCDEATVGGRAAPSNCKVPGHSGVAMRGIAIDDALLHQYCHCPNCTA
eukprot:7189907-Pyramimonas_sp.AAC.1